ncbi:MAG: hypothetical protein MRERV_88c002 [Mycoplasmataceae bacterium RV_VA103A]|nr:MAG: hypothetical protein MRERV_88c002 [Mycoplasmataceae bacterium RV_VA103A]
MIECEMAWQKYRSIVKEKDNFVVSKQLKGKVDLKTVSKELKKYGIGLSESQIKTIIDESAKYSVDYVPFVGPLIKKILNERKDEKWYREEVVIKCQKIREWQKEIKHLKSKKEEK